jgi:DNA repair ATPase RecN
MNIDHLTDDEKLQLLKQIEQHFGWHPVASVCVQDVKDYLESLDIDDADIPTDENISKACQYVARKAEVDINYLIDWAGDVAQELQDAQKVTA